MRRLNDTLRCKVLSDSYQRHSNIWKEINRLARKWISTVVVVWCAVLKCSFLGKKVFWGGLRKFHGTCVCTCLLAYSFTVCLLFMLIPIQHHLNNGCKLQRRVQTVVFLMLSNTETCFCIHYDLSVQHVRLHHHWKITGISNKQTTCRHCIWRKYKIGTANSIVKYNFLQVAHISCSQYLWQGLSIRCASTNWLLRRT